MSISLNKSATLHLKGKKELILKHKLFVTGVDLKV